MTTQPTSDRPFTLRMQRMMTMQGIILEDRRDKVTFLATFLKIRDAFPEATLDEFNRAWQAAVVLTQSFGETGEFYVK